MNRISRTPILSLLAAILTAGCADAPAFDDGPTLVDGISVALEVTPEEVVAGGELTARLILENRRDEPVSIVTSDACLARLSVRRGDRWVEVEGADRMCAQVLTTHQLDETGLLQQSWSLVARTVEGDPLPPGTYVLRVQPGVRQVNAQPVRVPEFERAFQVR